MGVVAMPEPDVSRTAGASFDDPDLDEETYTGLVIPRRAGDLVPSPSFSCQDQAAGCLVDLFTSRVALDSVEDDPVHTQALPSVRNLRFKDLDLDQEDLGGPVTWEPPDELAEVVGYQVYLAASNTGAQRSLVGGVVAGTNWIMVPPDTPARTPRGQL